MLALCLPPATALAVAAQAPQADPPAAGGWALADGAKIIEIVVEGLTRVDPEAALNATTLTAPGFFDHAAARADLEQIWRTGLFADVRLEAEPHADGVRLIWGVRERPTVHQVRLVGRDALSEDDLMEVVDIKNNSILDMKAAKRSAAKLRDLYLTRGHTLAEVEARVVPWEGGAAGQAVDVVFHISENAKVRVEQIMFIGNHAVSAADLRAGMQTREGNELSFVTSSGTFREEDFQTDLMRLQALYYDRGYVTVKIGQPTTTLSADRRQIYLSITIEEGEFFTCGDITAAGEVDLKGGGEGHDVDAAKLFSTMGLRKGDVFSRSRLFEDIGALTELYRDEGHAYANVTPNSRIDAQSRQVHLEIEVEQGPMVTFERIEIVGNIKTRDKVIRRELTIYEGQRFSGRNMALSRARIFQLGYFEDVNITTQPGKGADTIQARVEVKEKSTGTFNIGAGFNSAESFMANAQIAQENFLGHGQSIGLSAQLSFGRFAQRIAQLRFFEPRFLDSRFGVGAGAFLHRRLYRDFTRNAIGLSPTVGYPITHALRVNGGYTLEKVDISGIDSRPPVTLYGFEREGLVSAVNAMMAYDTRNNRLMPSKGTYNELRFDLSARVLGSDPTMAYKKIESISRFYLPVLRPDVVLRFNAQFGWAFGADGGVPISERYFPGGITSVRGFPPLSLGPTLRIPLDGTRPSGPTRNIIIGGNKQAIFNLELEVPLVTRANLRGVIFADAGNAYDEHEAMFYLGTPSSQHQKGWLTGSNRQVDPPLGLFWSAGVGLRLMLPGLGMLRFEWGFPIVKHMPEDGSSVFEFTIGNFF